MEQAVQLRNLFPLHKHTTHCYSGDAIRPREPPSRGASNILEGGCAVHIPGIGGTELQRLGLKAMEVEEPMRAVGGCSGGCATQSEAPEKAQAELT